jgi:hypothetical protein
MGILDTIESTLANKQWLIRHEDDLRNLLPEQWTLVSCQDFNPYHFYMNIKSMGVDINGPLENVLFMKVMGKIGILQSEGMLIRRNPEKLFHKVKPDLKLVH